MKELSDEMQKANNFPILMAGKYNNPILKDNYITKNRDYTYIARDFGFIELSSVSSPADVGAFSNNIM